MHSVRLVYCSLIFMTFSVFAEPYEIPLTDADQARLAKDLAKIDLAYRTEEVIQEKPYHLLRKTYRYLDKSHAFSINCSEDFIEFAIVGQDQRCEVHFDYDLSSPDRLEVHDGFMPAFAIAEIKDSKLASFLYKTIGNGVSPKVAFNSSEQLSFTHPATGEPFSAFRLRIACERDSSWKTFGCVVWAVK